MWGRCWEGRGRREREALMGGLKACFHGISFFFLATGGVVKRRYNAELACHRSSVRLERAGSGARLDVLSPCSPFLTLTLSSSCLRLISHLYRITLRLLEPSSLPLINHRLLVSVVIAVSLPPRIRYRQHSGLAHLLIYYTIIT